jgi:hypothetical protein
MDSVDDEYRWKELWLFLSSDWAAEFKEDLWLPTAAMSQIQAVTRRIVEPWVDANYLAPFTVAHYQLCSALETVGGAKLVHYIYDWRSLCFEGSLSGFKWLPLWRQENEQYIVEVPKKAADAFNAFRTAIIAASKQFTNRLEAFRRRGPSRWDYTITTRNLIGSLDELPELEREVMVESLQNIVDDIIRENMFVELWPSYLGSLEFDQLNGLFQSILMHREELSLTGVFIEFPGTWMFERGRLLRDRRT